MARPDAYAIERNAASLTSIKTVGGEEVLVLFGGGVYPDTYYNDTHILHLEDLPAAAAPEKPPPPWRPSARPPSPRR